MTLYFQIQCDCGALFVPMAFSSPVVEAIGTCPNCLTEHTVSLSTVRTSVPDDLSSLEP